MKKTLLFIFLFFSMGMVFRPTVVDHQMVLRIENPYGVTIRVRVQCAELPPNLYQINKKSITAIKLPTVAGICDIKVYDYSLF